jgi:DnaK suppressor protein
MFVSLPQLTATASSRVGLACQDEKEVHGRAQPVTQGINRGHDGVAPRTKGRLAGIEPHAADADPRRREVKAQPKVAAKSRKPAAKTPAKAKPAKPAVKAAKPAKPAVKAAKKAPAKAVKAPVKAVKPAAKAAGRPAAKAASKAPARTAPVKSAKTAKTTSAKTVKAAPKAAKPTTARKVAGAVAKSVVTGAKALAATAKKIPAKASPAPARSVAAKASHPPAAPIPAAVPPAPARAHGSPQAPAARAAPVPTPVAPAAFGAAKASYTPMANPSVLTPPPVVAIKKDPKLANNWKTKPAEELSDDEVLAMPDSEYMNEKQMAFFRLKLQQLKQEILNSAGETTEHLREDTVIVPDPADRATIEEEHALELRTRDRERKLLKKIEQSIARIDAGDYGYCDETGEPIGVGRLLARPTATLSLEAQQRRELKQKMFGD